MALRICFSILLFISVLFMPFWLSVILAFFGILAFPIYIESVVLLFLSDLLFGIGESRYHGIVFLGFLGAAAALIAVEVIKRKMKFYPRRA